MYIIYYSTYPNFRTYALNEYPRLIFHVTQIEPFQFPRVRPDVNYNVWLHLNGCMSMLHEFGRDRSVKLMRSRLKSTSKEYISWDKATHIRNSSLTRQAEFHMWSHCFIISYYQTSSYLWLNYTKISLGALRVQYCIASVLQCTEDLCGSTDRRLSRDYTQKVSVTAKEGERRSKQHPENDKWEL